MIQNLKFKKKRFIYYRKTYKKDWVKFFMGFFTIFKIIET